MHSRVDFKMYGMEVIPLRSVSRIIASNKRNWNFRFKLILEQGIETAEFRIITMMGMDMPVRRKSAPSVGYRHGQVIATMFLQCFGKFRWASLPYP